MGKNRTRTFLLLSASISIVIFALALTVGAATTLAQRKGRATERAYEFDTPGVKVEGTLIERSVVNPTPSRQTHPKVLILKLREPITINPVTDAKAKNSTNLESIPHVRELQLFVGSRGAEARKLVGRTVVAEGSLNIGIEPSIYTEVWMDVKDLHQK